MRKFHQVWRGRKRVLLPVIHACSFEQVHRQADIARDNGADGVFVINQGGLNALETLDAAVELADVFAGFFVGVNLLGRELGDVLTRVSHRRSIRGIWADDAEPRSWGEKKVVWRPADGLYFGGVAFKGQAQVDEEDLGDVTREAAAYGVDVVTTSGPSTGIACSPHKVAAMRQALNQWPLAVASGVSFENVDGLLPYVDAFLVASGIEVKFGEFNPRRLRELADRIHAYEPPEVA